MHHNLPLLISLVAVTAAIPLTVFVALTQNLENRSRAGENPPTYALTQLPLVEFGTIKEVIPNVIAPDQNIRNSTPNSKTNPPVGDCTPIPQTCVNYPGGIGACTGNLPIPSLPWCSDTSVNLGQYTLLTKDNRSYLLAPPPTTPPTCDGSLCPKTPLRPVRVMNFGQYLNQTVMVEGKLNGFSWWPLPSTGQITVNSIQPAQLKETNINIQGYLNYPYFSYYNNENVYYFDLNPVLPTAYTPQTGVGGGAGSGGSSATTSSSVVTTIASVPPSTPTPCVSGPNQPCAVPIGEPLGGPPSPVAKAKPYAFANSPYLDLSQFTGQKISVNADSYLVSNNDSFLNITSINNLPTPTVTPLLNLNFDPSFLNVKTNSPFTAMVTVNTETQKVTALDITLNFNQNLIKLVSLYPTSYMTRVLSSANIDNVNGQAHIALGVDPNSAVSGTNIPLLSINGQTLSSEGWSNISIASNTQVSAIGFPNNVLGSINLLNINIKNPFYWPGDLNQDGVVDIFDYNIMVQYFNKNYCGNPADADGNCKVDIFDYNLLVTNFGKKSSITCTPPPACLNSVPRCLPPVPPGGWCPPSSP